MKKPTFFNYLSILVFLFFMGTASAQYVFPVCAPAYDPAKGHYTGGEQCSLDGINYQASYWISTPPPSQGWVALGPCGDGGLGPDYAGQQRIIGYLPYWVPDYDIANDFDPSTVTHLNLAFILFQQNNNDFNSADFASIAWAPFHKRKVDSLLFDLNVLGKAHQAGVTVSVAIGGATDFAFIWLMERYYQNDAKLEEIANLIVDYVNTTGIDGVDLDLECWWPDPAIAGTVEKGGRIRGDKWGGVDQGPEPAAVGLTKLAQKLRQKMPAKLLSAAVFGTSWYGNNYDDALADHLDWLGLMTYDFTGSWDKTPFGPHSSLYKVPLNTYPLQSLDNPIYSAEDALEYWMGIADPAWNHDGGFDVPKAKLCIGVPLYGYDFATKKPDGGNGYIAVAYRNIIAQYPNAATSYDPQNHTANYGGKVDQIYYNTPAGAAAKYNYTADYGHQGLIIWELTQDVPFNNNASIMKAINDAAGNVVGTPPVCNITSPTSGQSFSEGITIPITATASDADGTVSKVDFYADNVLIGTDATSPYSYNWINATIGAHDLKAVATDNDGKTGVSPIVPIVVEYTPVLTSIEVSPATATIVINGTQQFDAQGYDQTGAPMNTTVSWTATGGSINASGLYTGSALGTFTVTATSGAINGTASVTVLDDVTPVLTRIEVSPATSTISEGQTQQFAAQGYDQFDAPIATNVTWTTSSNSISTSGLYTGTVATTSTVTATDGSVFGTATITVNPVIGCTAPQYVAGTPVATGESNSNNNVEYECIVGGWCSSDAAWAYEPGVGAHWEMAWVEVGPCGTTDPVLTSIEVSPATVTIQLNETQQFTAQGLDQNGNPMVVTITWSASAGPISTSGLYTGSVLGTHTITATSGTISGSASVTVEEIYVPVLTSIEVTPANSSITEGQTQQFNAQGLDQNNNPMSTTVTWSTTSNSISASGLYTGTTATTSTVSATSGNVVGSTSITVNPVSLCPYPLWSCEVVYTNEIVQHNGHAWKAKWWTQCEEPGTTGEWGVWEDLGICTGLKNSRGTASESIVLDLNIYPNPFTNALNFDFILTEEKSVTLKIYNEIGAEVSTLVNDKLPVGNHTIPFEGTAIPAGLYFYKLTIDNNVRTGNIIKK